MNWPADGKMKAEKKFSNSSEKFCCVLCHLRIFTLLSLFWENQFSPRIKLATTFPSRVALWQYFAIISNLSLKAHMTCLTFINLALFEGSASRLECVNFRTGETRKKLKSCTTHTRRMNELSCFNYKQWRKSFITSPSHLNASSRQGDTAKIFGFVGGNLEQKHCTFWKISAEVRILTSSRCG